MLLSSASPLPLSPLFRSASSPLLGLVATPLQPCLPTTYDQGGTFAFAAPPLAVGPYPPCTLNLFNGCRQEIPQSLTSTLRLPPLVLIHCIATPPASSPPPPPLPQMTSFSTTLTTNPRWTHLIRISNSDSRGSRDGAWERRVAPKSFHIGYRIGLV
jgi:hypothetical protein